MGQTTGNPIRFLSAEWFACAVLFCAAILTVVLTTRLGIGTSVDSIAYIQAARLLAAGSDMQLVQHAPLYSALLASGGLLRVDPLDLARWANALTFGCNILLLAILSRAVSNSTWWWIAGPLLGVALAPMLKLHATALSEPVFLSLLMSCLWLLARHLERPATSLLIGTALLCGLALLARYAGAACVLTGVLACLLFERSGWRLRFKHAIIFGSVASVPLALWVTRNMIVEGSSTGRTLNFHPVNVSHAWQALYTASGWLLIPQSAPDTVRIAACSALAIGFLAVVLRQLQSAPLPAMIRLLTLLIASYSAFLLVSISFLDANIPLDDRMLSPILVSGVIILVWTVDTLWPAVRRRAAVAVATVLLIAAFSATHASRTLYMAKSGYEEGWGFSSRSWRQSPVLASLHGFSEDVTVYSNAPELVYLHTGFAARRLPRTQFLMSQQVNQQFESQLTLVAENVRAQCGVVVYVRGLSQRSIAAESELRRVLGLDALVDETDGAIWGISGCSR